MKGANCCRFEPVQSEAPQIFDFARVEWYCSLGLNVLVQGGQSELQVS